MKLAIYGHGGSQNHGNEAIVRGVRAIFPDDELTLFSFSVQADKHFRLDDICTLKSMTAPIRGHIFLKLLKKIGISWKIVKKIYYKLYFAPFLNNIDKDTVYLIEAGDQYCELGDHRFFYSYLNKKIVAQGAKTVMLGCTINPELLDDKDLIKDLENYSLIIARESITYKALLEKNLSTKIFMAPCPAFAMKEESIPLPDWMERKSVIGFNIGFLQQGNEKYYELLFENYQNAIIRVLSDTDYEVALIPHVNWNYETTDFTALDELFSQFRESNRVHIINEHSAPQQKYIISKCKAFVSLRTHATIPALESQVPTIITGYKTKSRGLAKDIFADNFQVLADVQSLSSKTDIAETLFNLLENEDALKQFYKKRMPEYLDNLMIIKDSIYNLTKE